MGLRSTLARWLNPELERDMALTLSQYVAQYFTYGGMQYPLGGYGMQGDRETINRDFAGYVQGAYKTNGVVFACLLARLMLFSQARFIFRQRRKGRPGDLFSLPQLDLLARPWTNATTADLLGRAIQDADLAGNFFAARIGQQIRRLRPDWTFIVLGSSTTSYDGQGEQVLTGDAIDIDVLGYGFQPGGPGSGAPIHTFLPHEVCHFAPIPDPLATFRGMSWLEPIVREVQADTAANVHKLKFFENAATSNTVWTFDPSIGKEAFEQWVSKYREGHEGVLNAYKSIFIGGGATPKVIGADFEQMDFKVVQGAGEPLALDTPIPTPTGWTTMGEVAVGDEVFGRDGRPVRVVGTSPIHVGRPCYRVTFSDRTSIVADAGHLWTAIDRSTASRSERTYTTEALAALLAEWRDASNGGNRMAIPAGAPVKLEERDLLVDPYVLGVWLGDGQTAGAAVCGANDDLAVITGEIERRGYTVTRWATKPDRVPVVGLPGGLLAALAAIGVLGHKHIPADYLRASAPQRLDLLRGLMDMDGSVGHTGKETCEYSSKLECLARQVAELARSLGYRATVSEKLDVRSRTGSMWRVTFRADPDVVPFLLPRKAERCMTPVWVKNRAVVAVEPVASIPVRCIAVDAADHLFRAGEGWTLTHNTRICAAAGVPPVIVGLSEGLAAATYSNYGQARRHFAASTMAWLWQNMAGSMATLMPPPAAAELWYDTSGIPFVADDVKDAAEIGQLEAAQMSTLINAGFEPDSVVDAVTSGDRTRLVHSGLVSVQLQPPGTVLPPAGGRPALPAPAPPPPAPNGEPKLEPAGSK